MLLIQSLKNEFCLDLPLFSKYPDTSINSYFYKMTLFLDDGIFSECFTCKEPSEGFLCDQWDFKSNYFDICDGTDADCMEKGKAKCTYDPYCHGITWKFVDDSTKGVLVCTSPDLVEASIPADQMNICMKC